MSRPSEQLWEATPRLHCVFSKKKSFVLNLCTRTCAAFGPLKSFCRPKEKSVVLLTLDSSIANCGHRASVVTQYSVGLPARAGRSTARDIRMECSADACLCGPFRGRRGQHCGVYLWLESRWAAPEG